MTTAHLASIPSRQSTLGLVLDSIVPFVDHTFIALNGYNFVPEWFSKYTTLTYRVLSNEKGDANKFAFINEVNGLVLITDDDLIWNPRAINLLQQAVSKYQCPCSYHGKLYIPPIRGFKYINENYRCLGNTTGDHIINVIGTGTLMFNTSMIKLSLDDFPVKNMADIWYSKLASEQGVKLMVIEHGAGIVGYLSPKDTIWTQTKDYSPHTHILKKFIK